MRAILYKPRPQGASYSEGKSGLTPALEKGLEKGGLHAHAYFFFRIPATASIDCPLIFRAMYSMRL